MKNWIYTCFLILGLANMSNLIASHSLGSDMSYRCIGPDQYEVTLNIYRDCAGASLGSSETVNWTASCGSGSITVNRLPNYPIDITPVCVTQPSSCGGGSGPFGVEQHTYTAILNLPAGCTNITFSWNLCCRNNAITTLNLPGSQSMHIEAQLDNSVTPCNNSPVFLNPPVGFACDGFPVFFSDGGFDPDGDSLSFSLVDCQNSSATPVNYNAGFSGSNPLTSVSPIHIDSSTGAITFTPVGPQIFVMCVLVEEYRNGVKIGEITRDIQFRILNCTNAAPTATGVDGSSSYEATACANTPICFDIDVADANAGDSITINSNNGLAGSTITTIQDTATGALKGQFCWTPTAADVGKHSFTITLQDDACPIIGTNTYTYDINVAPNPNPPVNAGSNTQICQGQSTTLNASSTATNIQAVWWTPSAGLSNPTSLTTQASPDTTTTYTIYTDHIDGCISTDQVTVSITSAPPAPNVSTDSISVCEGESIVLNATTSATGYYWSNAHGFSSTAQSPIIPNASILDTGRYNLYVIDASGCQSLDTFVYVSVNAPPVAPTIVSNSPLCFGDTLNISSSSHCGQSQWIGPNGNSAGTLGIPSANNVLWTLGSTTNIPSTDPNYLSGSWYMVCIDTLTGCQANSNTINITINTIPNTPLAFNNGPVCIGESVQLSTSALSGASYAWYADSTQTALLSTSQNPTITNIITDSTFYLFVTVNGCTSLAGSTTVNVHAVPTTPSVPADFAVCEGEAIVLNTTTTANTYVWTGPNGFNSNLQNPTAIASATLIDTGAYNLYIIDANGCLSGDTTVQVTVNANPAQPVLSSNSAICEGQDLILSTTATATNYVWTAPNGADTITTVATLLIDATNTFYQDGAWTLILIDANTCQSMASATEQVVINTIPNTPLAFNNGPVCIGQNVHLSTSALSGASYAWYADATQTTLLSTSQNPTINNITTDSTFYLFVTVNGCTSLAGSTTVNVHAVPTTPSVPADFAVCEGEAIVLNTTTTANTYVWTGPNGFNSNLQNPTAIASATLIDTGAYNLYIIDANGCLSGDTTVQVTVHPIPTTPLIASNNTPICEGDSLVLTTNTVAGTTFEWFNAANLSVGTGDTLVITPTTMADAGSYYVVGTANGCASQASLTTTVSIEQIPSTVAYAGADINLCNQFDTILQATPPTGATGVWRSASTGTIANPNLATTVISNLPSGANVFYWTLSNGTCVDFSTDSVVVDASPLSSDTANAGLDQQLCGQTTINLNANTPLVSTGYWTQSATQSSQGVVITNPTNPNSTVTGVQQGNSYTFTWTLSNGNCTDYSSDNVTINIDVAPPDVAYAGTDIAICNSNTVNLNAYVSTQGTGFWTTNSTATIVDPTNATTPIVNLANNDTSVFYWTLSNGTCLNYSTDSVFVIVSTATAVADAGTNQVVCGQSSLNLAGVAPTVGIGTWSQTANQAAQGVNIIDPNDPLSLVTGLQQGNSYTFTWTLTNGSCIDYSSDVVILTITQSPPDNAYAGADIDLCGTSSTNLAAAGPSVATGVWSTTSTATIANPTDPATTIANLPFGTSTFIWTLSGGSCLNYDSDTVLVTVTQPSGDVADAGLDTAFCAQTTINLNATMPSIGLGYWTQTPAQASLGVLINDINDPNSLVSGLSAGRTYEFTWTLTNGGCTDYSSDKVLITIDVFPNDVAYAGEDTVLCGGNALDLGATMPPIGSGLWTTNDSATLVDPSLAHSEAVFILEDTTVYYWTLSNGACVDYSTDSIQVVLAPVSNDLAAAGFDQILCGVDSISLNGSIPTTSTGLWTQPNNQASQGIIIQNPNDPNTGVTGLQVGNVYNFTWTLSTTGCPDFSTDDVNYTINALPTEVAYAGPDIVLCDGNTTSMLANVPISSTGIWSSNSGAVIINPSLPNTSVVNITADTTQLYWTLSNGSCVNYSIDTMLVIAAPTTIDPADAGLDLAICNETTGTLAATNPTIATGVWSQTAAQASLGVNITNPTNPNTGITGLAADQTYSFQWTLSSGPCIDYDSDEAVVEVSRLPKDNAYGGEDIVICGLNQTILNATPPTVGTGVWSTTSGAVLVNPTEPTTEVLDVELGISQFVWSISNGACKDYSRDTLLVVIDNAPVANDDSIVIEYNADIDPISVVDNDKLVGLWAIHLVTYPKKGKLENLTDGTFELTNSDILTTQQFSYRLCNPACPDIFCDTAQVTIKIEGGFDCKVPNVITPNEDEINDMLFIPCLENYPNTKLAIFNRWGDQVYESDNYQNDWEGTYNGNPVPDGTFYYIMILPTGDELQGFVEVRR